MPDDLSGFEAQIQEQLTKMSGFCTKCLKKSTKCNCAWSDLRKKVTKQPDSVFPEVSVVNVPKCHNCDTPDKKEMIPCSSCGVL